MSQEKELDMVDRDPNGLNAHVKVYTWSIGFFSLVFPRLFWILKNTILI